MGWSRGFDVWCAVWCARDHFGKLLNLLHLSFFISKMGIITAPSSKVVVRIGQDNACETLGTVPGPCSDVGSQLLLPLRTGFREPGLAS